MSGLGWLRAAVAAGAALLALQTACSGSGQTTPGPTAPSSSPSGAPSAATASAAMPPGPQAPTPGAVEDFTSLARGTGTPADRQLAAGDAALAAGEPDRAMAAFQQAAQLAPDDPAPVVGVVRAELARDEVPTEFNSAPSDPTARAAAARLRELIGKHADYAPAHLEYGRTLLVLGQAERGLGSLAQAVALQNDNPEAHSAMGVALLATGQLEDALRALERAANLDPSNVARHTNLGTALILASRVDEAIQVFLRAVALAPEDPRAASDLGTAYLAAGDGENALVPLLEAIKREPANASYQSNIGFAYLLLGQPDRAIAHCREAVRLDPQHASAWINLGNGLARQGKYSEARQAYERAKAIDADDPRVEAVMEELDQLERRMGTP